MITLREACLSILRTHDKEQIFRVNEFDTAYECLLINDDEDPRELRKTHGILPAVVCYKADGKITDDLFMGEWAGFRKESFRSYEAEDIANLLKEERRGA